MTQKFKPGDVCEIVGPVIAKPLSCAAYVGMECTIVSGPHPHAQFPSRCYFTVTMYDDRQLRVDPKCLRKRKPPADPRSVVKWSECPWQPGRVAA